MRYESFKHIKNLLEKKEEKNTRGFEQPGIDSFNYHGTDPAVKNLISRAKELFPSADNDFEAVFSFISTRFDQRDSEINNIEVTNKHQQREINRLRKQTDIDHKTIQQQNQRYRDQEARFKELNAMIASQGGKATPDQIVAAQMAQELERQHTRNKASYYDNPNQSATRIPTAPTQQTTQQPQQQPANARQYKQVAEGISSRLFGKIARLRRMPAHANKDDETLARMAAEWEKREANPQLYKKPATEPAKPFEKPKTDPYADQNREIMSKSEWDREYNEDNVTIGTAPKRPIRPGSRPNRGHETVPRYTVTDEQFAEWMLGAEMSENKQPKQPPKPRNFVAKNAIQSGAGAHKDKKKAMKQGDVKHKKKDVMMEVDPHNYDSDIDYYNALKARPKQREYDPEDEIERRIANLPMSQADIEDEISMQRQRSHAKTMDKVNTKYIDVEGTAPNGEQYNKLYVIHSDDPQAAKHAEHQFHKHEWGAKKVVDTTTTKHDDGSEVITMYIVDNHKHGYWKPWKDQDADLKEAQLPESLLDYTRRRQIIHFLAKKFDWEISYLELATDHELIRWYKAARNGQKPMEEEVVTERGKAPRSLCIGSKPDDELGASQLASCKSQGLRARDGEKSHKLGKDKKSRIKVGGHKIKGKKYGGPLPDWS